MLNNMRQVKINALNGWVFRCNHVEVYSKTTSNINQSLDVLKTFAHQKPLFHLSGYPHLSPSLTVAVTIASAVMAEEEMEGKVMEGVASIALIDNGSISGHFIHLPHSICYGIHGTEMVCERECSRGEDYRLVKLIIIDYNRKRERDVIVECRGHDAARIQNVQHAHGWEDDVVNMLDEKEQKHKILVSFECETLKAGKEAEDHINKFMPKLAGTDAVVNIGKMRIVGLDFEDATGDEDNNQQNI